MSFVEGSNEKPGKYNIAIYCFRISILKDQKEKQNEHSEKLHGITDELTEQAERLGEKLVETYERHEQLLQR